MLLKSLDERHCVKAGCGLTKTQHETKPGKDGKASVRAAKRFCFNNLHSSDLTRFALLLCE